MTRSGLILLVLTLAGAGLGPELRGQTPDRHGEAVSSEPSYAGTAANAPIPGDLHIRNEGGSDGAGLCVIASLLINGRYQGVPGLEDGKGSDLWRTAKSRPGGYYPEKLERLLKELYPDEEWFSWEGDGTELVAHYSALGYPVAATTNTGALYGYQSIHHMISVVHLDEDLACIVDNNDPGKYHWMPASEFAKRFVDGPKGWGFVWLRKPGGALGLALFLPTTALLGAGLLLIVVPPRRNTGPLP
jgi:hypothetical protein